LCIEEVVGKNNLLVTVWSPRNSPALRLEEIPIAALKRNPLNPRVHPEKQIRMLAESIAAFGFFVPCLVDQHNRLINGHARVLAAERRGMASVPCIRIEHLNEVDKRAFVVADAKLSELGHWDPEILRNELRFFSELHVDFNFSVIGFDTGEVDHILEAPISEPGDERSMATHARRPAISRRGDLWQAGRHVVLCADPLVTDSYEPLERARLVIADPPQWLIRGSDADHDGRGDRDRAVSDATGARTAMLPAVNLPAESLPTECLLRNFAAASLDGSLHYIGTGGRHLGETLRAGKAVYSEWLDTCVWCLPTPDDGGLYRCGHALVLVFKSGAARHVDNIKGDGGGRNRSTLWSYPHIKGARQGRNRHGQRGNSKPVALAADIIKDASARGEWVLAAFAGADAVLLAAEETGRRAAIIDDNPQRIDVAIRRWQSLTGRAAVCTRSGETFAGRQALVHATCNDET
jgi:hypothetical protein